LAETAGLLVNGWLYMFPAVTIGNAILRHRLYDIDIIIRRTLVYSILTGILAVIYFGGVIVVQQLLRPLTESSDLAIVVSTLLIAALFSPLRRRIQSTIDRRFFRRKYDAEQTLARFNQTLRDEVDIETLKAELVGVVQETMQPTKIALWMKETK
jgi:branched-subunit amino acid ABC-type transport system permease component